MALLLDPTTLGLFAHVAVVAAVFLRVIMLRPAPGVALAWLLLVAVLPAVGVVLYLLFGERRISSRRALRIAALRRDFDEFGPEFLTDPMVAIDWSRHPPESLSLATLGRNLTRLPAVNRSALELYTEPDPILEGIAADVDAAQTSVALEFYIWNEGGAADLVVEALIRAAGRGVSCRVLVDDLGSARWLRGRQPARLRAAGVELREALEVGLLRTLVARNDLRLHRKVVLIDGRVAWTGSMNLVDPRHFKQGAGVGEWIDAMVRIEGHTVLTLGAVLLTDWQLESGEPVRDLARSLDLHLVAGTGEADVQVVPSGPGESGDAILQMILELVYAARRELILTTPYFVPDEAMLVALRAAAGRGVEVHLVVPDKNDSLLVRYASRSYYADLLEAGVKVWSFRGGLLHTKSIAVDGEISMFGTVNLDMRSLWLNYEVSLFVYDVGFTGELLELQRSYIARSEALELATWAARPVGVRFVENLFRLVSPLL